MTGTIAGPLLASLQGNTFLGPYITQSIAINATTTNLINNTIPDGNTVVVSGTTRTDVGNSFDRGQTSGMVSVNAATSGNTKFAKTYANAPNCTLTPTTDPTAAGVGLFWATSTTQAVTANVHSTGTIVFIYHCDGF